MAISASLPVVALIQLILGANITSAAVSSGIFEALLFSSILLERVLLHRNALATVRRLLAVATVANVVWLFCITVGFALSLAAAREPTGALVVGMFYAVAFRLLVFRSVFCDSLPAATILAFLQPLLLGSAAASSLLFGGLAGDLLPASIVGLTTVGLAGVYLSLVNRVGRGYMKVEPLTFLHAFLLAWSTNEPDSFEAIVEKAASPATVKTHLLHFRTGWREAVLVLPEVHPGPFYPIGSSNLPYQIHQRLARDNYIPLVLHGVSGHELNLPSKAEVERYLASFTGATTVYESAVGGGPVAATVNKVTVSAVAFSDVVLLTLSLAPHGAEDFPSSVKEGIERIAKKTGFQHVFVVDAHNSEGKVPTDQDVLDALSASETALVSLRAERHRHLRAGAAHSSELNVQFDQDVGPAGVSALVLEVDGTARALIAFDANNALPGIREAIAAKIRETDVSMLEVCTSDTHVTAGRSRGAKGYYALGEKTDARMIVEAAVALVLKARERLAPATMTLRIVETTVKVVGAKLLEKFSQGLDRVTSVAKIAGVSVGAITLALLLVMPFV